MIIFKFLTLKTITWRIPFIQQKASVIQISLIKVKIREYFLPLVPVVNPVFCYFYLLLTKDLVYGINVALDIYTKLQLHKITGFL